MKKDIDLINPLPDLQELEKMIDFCGRHKKIYIYGAAYNQQHLFKYLEMCGINVSGYVVTDKSCVTIKWFYRPAELKDIFTVMKEEESGIIIGLSEKYYNEVIPLLCENRYSSVFFMSEYNKQTIAKQVRKRCKEEMTVEVSLADHCNLSCQMCDHYSQLSKPSFLNETQFKNDIVRLGELFDNSIGCIWLLGGEPTLNENIIEIIRITRCQFPDSEIRLLTNGVLLLQWEHSKNGNLWEALFKYNIHIILTIYPINLDYEAIEKKANEYKVLIDMSSDIHAEENTKVTKISDKHTMKLDKSVEKFYCIGCLYYNKFNTLKNGRIYMCPVSAHSDIFNSAFEQKLELTEMDSIDIYKINSWEEIAEFSSCYVPFCSYCDLKNWGHHSSWKPSTKKIEEYI